MTYTQNGNISTKENDIFVKVTRWAINNLFHQILAVISIYSVWYFIINYSNPFSWHVILSTLGFVPIMAEAIVLFSGDNTWTHNMDRKAKYGLHGVLIFVGTVLLTAGIAVETKSKSDRGAEHFVSDHAWTGLVGMVLSIVSLFLGILSANAQKLNKYARPVWFKFVHNIIGIFGFVFGVVSLIYGFHLRAFHNYASDESIWTATIFTAIVGLWAIHQSLISCFQQLRNIIF